MKIRTVSLFNGMSCGKMALDVEGIDSEYYYSEIDKYGNKLTESLYPDAIPLGDVRGIDYSKLPKIDLLIGGSPCQSFSFAGKRKGMVTSDNLEILSLEHYLQLKKDGFEFEGQSYLFWEFVRALKELKPTYFLLENVIMVEKWRKVLSQNVGIAPIRINSARVSAQNRDRYYWTNIAAESGGLFGNLVCKIKQPKDKGILLRDILESEVNEKYYLSEKLINGFVNHTIKKQSEGCGFKFEPQDGSKKDNAVEYSYRQDAPISEDKKKYQCLRANAGGKTKGVGLELKNSKIRRLTPRECLRLQTVPEHLIDKIMNLGISDTQIYKMAGNGWTVDIIAYIFSHLKQ